MHNSKRKNLEFAIVWCETNLRYLYGDPESEERNKKIEDMKSWIQDNKKQLEGLSEDEI